MKLSFRRIRRAGGRLLDALTIVDHLFSRKDLLFKTTELGPDLLNRIKDSQTVLIYGTHFPGAAGNENEDLLLANLENFWPIIRIANSDVIESRSGWLIRANRGRDLALLREGLETFASEISAKNILWFNSSCSWDSDLLRKCISELENSSFLGVTSLTDSWLGGYHLQSYFLFYKKEISREVTKVIIDTIDRNWRLKRTLIYRGERRLTSNFHKARIDSNALFSSKKLNPRNYRWENLYTDNSEILDKLSIPGRKFKVFK